MGNEHSGETTFTEGRELLLVYEIFRPFARFVSLSTIPLGGGESSR